MNLFKPSPSAPQTQPQSLFDPFYGGSQTAWKPKTLPTGCPVACEVITTDILEILTGLAAQFTQTQLGWWAVVVQGTGLQPTPNQQDVLATLIPQALGLTERAWLLILPSGRLLFVLQRPKALATESITELCKGLLPDHLKNQTLKATWHDLALEPTALTELLSAETGWIASQHARQQAQTTALAKQHAQVQLTPTDLARRQARKQAQTRPVVLVVEDDPSTRMLLVTMLNKGAMVFEAADAHTAARLYERHLPDMVLLDIGLPDVSGLSMLKEFKAADPHACVVMLTANATGENIKTAIATGAAHFLAKPFTRDRVLHSLTFTK